MLGHLPGPSSQAQVTEWFIVLTQWLYFSVVLLLRQRMAFSSNSLPSPLGSVLLCGGISLSLCFMSCDCCLLAAAVPRGWPHWPPHLEAAAEEWQPLVPDADEYLGDFL